MILKNLAGNNVDIFLFRFELRGKGIDFVLNEAIAADMYQDIDEKMKPLVHVCSETLLRYRHLSVGNTIMDGNILADGGFEVMLSKGLGKHFAADEKQQLFQDAKNIADLLATVMDRRTREEKQGKQRKAPHAEHSQGAAQVKKGLEALGREKRLESELQWLAERRTLRPGLRQLRPEDLPPGVTASIGYDHRGQCYVFEHKTLGELGRIVMIKRGDGQMLMQADLCHEQEDLESPRVKKKKKVFETIIAAVHDCFEANASM